MQPNSRLLPSSVLLFILFFFSLTNPNCYSQDVQYDDCEPLDFDCGGSSYTIKYPFGYTNRNRASNCSYPGYNLTCEENALVAQSLSNRFRIKSIDYEDHTLNIVERDFTGGDCQLPVKNGTIDFIQINLTSPSMNANSTFFLFNYTDQVQNLTLYNCSSRILDSGLSDFRSIPCPTNPYNYLYFTSQQKNPLTQFEDCSPPIIIPLLTTNVRQLLDYQMDLDAAIRNGFDVTWIKNGWCDRCERSGGRCFFDESKPYDPTCLCRDEVHLFSCPGDEPNLRRKIIIGISTGLGVFFLLLCFCCCKAKCSPYNYISSPYNYIFISRQRRYENRKVEAFLRNYGSFAPKRYRYSELKKITNSFKDKLGQGGFGGVYKGKFSDNRLVAVKLLNSSKGKGEDFINEVASIGRTYHVNVVSLLGFCYEGSKRALIYEFMPNGSLEKFIYCGNSGTRHHLGCEKLFQIAVGIARGLEYLHRGCSTRILHFDIKPHNILLDDDFCPKISDFGLAKICLKQESMVSMLEARGTVGYIAPEVFCRSIGTVSYKSDVYSYGMMILEMVGGRKNIDAGVENTSEIYFPHWVYERISLKEGLGLSGNLTQGEEEIAKKMILVGLWCIQTNPATRPSMSRVVEMLDGSLEVLQMPPKPYLSSPSRPPSHDLSTAEIS